MSAPDSSRHTLAEDAQGLATSVALCAFALTILTQLGLMTGQTAGLAAIISYGFGWDFGLVFFAVNIPFYALSVTRMGWRFTLKTFMAVTLLSLLTHWMPPYFRIEYLHPLLGAVLFGLLVGVGLVLAFRHGASLGGISIVAVYLQDKTGFRAGWTQLGFDVVLFGVAAWLLDWQIVGYSIVGAIVMNVAIALNHRRDRYIGH